MSFPVLESWDEITIVTSLRRRPVLPVAGVAEGRQRTLSRRGPARSLELGPPGLRPDPCYSLAACRFPHLQNGLSDACLAGRVRIKWAGLSRRAGGRAGWRLWLERWLPEATSLLLRDRISLPGLSVLRAKPGGWDPCAGGVWCRSDKVAPRGDSTVPGTAVLPKCLLLLELVPWTQVGPCPSATALPSNPGTRPQPGPRTCQCQIV